jgi:LacI family transcriptional regulator
MTGVGSSQLGVVFEHASGSFMSGIIMGIDEEAFSLNVQINLCISNNSYEREAENLQRLANQGIDKILLFMVLDNEENTMNPNIPLYLRLQEQGIRIFLLVCNIPGFPIPSVTYDDYSASRSLVKFLKEKNCRRLVHVSRLDNASTTIERIRGFKDGLLDHSLSYDERRIVRVKCADVDSVVTDASSRFGEFLKNGDLVDAVVCSDELVAAGVFDALDKMGIPPRSRPIVGGMGCLKNVHVLKGNPYILAEDDTYRLGREAAHAALMGEFPTGKEKSAESFRRVIPVPLRIPKSLR